MSEKYTIGQTYCKHWPILAVPKPRMTRRDKWRKRKPVLRYRSFKDELRIHGVYLDVKQFYHLVFLMPMPASWQPAERSRLLLQPHMRVPDKDNLEKGFLDALFAQDAEAWDGRITKVWSIRPGIIVANYSLTVTPEALAEIIMGTS